MMIDGIGDSKMRPGNVARPGIDRTAPVARVGDSQAREVGTPASPAARMAAAGPPVDADKIAAIRAAIAEGRYPVDPEKIAARMIALDLGPAR